MEETTDNMNLYEQICHPLLLDLVLEKMFGHLSKQSLMSCRLVCRQWVNLSAIQFRRNNCGTIITLSNQESVISFMSTFVHTTHPSWINFHLKNFFELSLYDRQLFFNICSASIKSLRLSPGNSVDLVELFSMISKSLPQLEKLELDGLRSLITNQLSQSVSRYLNFELGRNRISELLTWHSQQKKTDDNGGSLLKFQKLKHLKIVVQMEADTRETSFLFFKLILSLTPKLTSFVCSCLDTTMENTTIPGLIQAMANSPSILIQLTKLRIDELSNAGLNSLIHFQLKLTKLSLLAPMEDVQLSTIENLIKSQAETLEELTIGGSYCRMASQLEIKNLSFPFSMPRLRRLNFAGGMSIGSNHFEYISPIPWTHLDYSQQLPRLETLGLFYLSTHAMDLVWPDNNPQQSLTSPCFTLKEIEFRGGVEPIQSGKLTLLGRVFPGIEEFSGTISSGHSILAIFDTWPKLQSLELRLTSIIYNLDFFFTGIQLDKVDEEPELRSTLFVQEDNNQSLEYLDLTEHSQPRKSTNILLLQDLKKLSILLEFLPSFNYPKDSSLLSDITTMTALRHLPKLSRLVINRSAMTENGLQILNQDLTLEKCHVGDQFGHVINFRSDPSPVHLTYEEESDQVYYDLTNEN